MKILFSTLPMTGHFHAMAPLALSLAERGHTVAFATGRGFAASVEACGFRHFPCGLDFDGSRDIFEALPEWESIKAGRPGNLAIQQLHGFAQGLSPRMADDLLPVAANWKPDLIVRDMVDLGGYIVAERLSLPHATVLWAFYISMKETCGEAILALRKRYGLPDDPSLDSLDRFLVLDYLPESWALQGIPYPAVARRFRAMPYDGDRGSCPPAWISALPDQPTVYATLGTTFNQAPYIFRAMLDAFRDAPWNLVMTVGRSMDPAAFGPQPDNIRVERYLPQSSVLPHCQGIIFHGGFNTLHSALWHGLPMVVLPQGAGDQAPTARRCADLGLGISIEDARPSAENIRNSVRTILEDTGYRERVKSMREKMMALPPLEDAVGLLESMVEVRYHGPEVNP